MVMHKLFRMHWWTFLLLATCVTLTSRPAEAIPAFARQTGQPCTACHIGGFGPQLTPLGRAFKIGGYTQGGGEGIGSMIPLSLMIQASFNHTGDDQFVSNGNGGLTPFQQHYAANNNFSLDQISGFLGGHIGDHVGGFAQFTWSDVDNTASVDNMDLRPFTTLFNVGGKDLRVGITLNNAPTVQDPYNTTFSWGFPFISSLIVPQPAADVFLSSGFDHSALGYTVYAWYDTKLYLEAGVYSTMSPWLLPRFGNGIAAGRTTSPAPYFRAAYEWQWDKNAAHIGATFLHADVRPLRSPDDDAFTTTGDFGTDHYTDYGLDAGYQFLGDGTHIVTVQGMFVHEEQNLKASASQIPIDGHFNLNQIRANVSYWYQNTYGLTLGWQKTWGPPNPVLVDSANNKPNTNAFIVEADWVPFGKDNSFLAPNVNLKLGLQYTAYTEFNGGGSNFDGAGHNASGNNTLLLFVWLIF
jgi:hypothetical protein